MRLHNVLTRLAASGQPIPPVDLAMQLGVSLRTLQGDIARLRRLSDEHGFVIRTLRGRGVLLSVEDQNRFTAFINQLAETSSDSSATACAASIVHILLLDGGYVSTSVIAQRLSMSAATVKNQINEAQEYAQAHGLTIVSARHHGSRIKGNPRLQKQVVAEEIAANTSQSYVCQQLAPLIERLSPIHNILTDALNAEGLGINYLEFCFIQGFIIASVAMPGLGPCDVPSEFCDDERLLRVAHAVLEEASRLASVNVHAHAVTDLALELSAYVRNASADDVTADDIRFEVNGFLSQIDSRFDTDYAHDEILREMLQTHVLLLVNRLLQRRSCKNPCTDQIDLTKSLSSDTAILLADRITDRWGVTPSADEIGFIAMHFAAHDERTTQNRLRDVARIAVICSTGGGGALLVRMQLESIFSKAEVLALSHLEQDKLKEFSPDLIFSMVPLTVRPQAPVVSIREVLSEADLLRIRELVGQADFLRQNLPTSGEVWNLLTADLFSRCNASDYGRLIEEMAVDLVRRGIARKDYPQLVVRREHYASTVYLNGICVPHPVEAAGFSDAISVRVLERPFICDERPVRVVIMICLTAEHLNLYKPITRDVYDLMRVPSRAARLAACNSASEFKAIIREVAPHE